MKMKELLTKHRTTLIMFSVCFIISSLLCTGSWAATTDKASWVSETISDNTKMTGGSSFNKTWTIKNSGTSTWTSSYKLKYASNQGGRLSSTSEVKISGSISPGKTYTFTVPMKAPAAQTSEKTYREDWKFTNASGSTISVGSSSTIWAQIKVSATAPPLTDKASLVSETIPDNTKVPGGTAFEKKWTIKNSGTSTWTSSYKLTYASNQGGRLSSISEVKISGSVSPGNSYTFTVPMKAPAAQTSEKTYREDWKFTNASGSTISVGSSPTIWVQIKVSGIILDPGPFPTVDWNSSAYRSANLFWNSLFAPQTFYSDGRISQLGSAKGNCTWYAHGRLRQLGYTVNLNVMTGNAYTWSTSAKNAGITVNTTPTAGAIAQSTANRSIYGSYGHVAVVEKVNADGTLLISESSYAPGSKDWDFQWRNRSVSNSEFNNYIHVTK
jgi:surface antigen